MARWHNIRLRGDLYEVLFARAAQDRRSVAQMADVLLTQALQTSPPEIDLSEVAVTLESADSPRRELRSRVPLTEPVFEGQTTVDEMLASCPQCAGELHPAHDFQNGGPTVRCVDCGWVREPSDG